MSDSPSSSPELDRVLAEYIAAEEEGRPLDRQALLTGNPLLAGELREFFANRDQMQRVPAPLPNGVDKVVAVSLGSGRQLDPRADSALAGSSQTQDVVSTPMPASSLAVRNGSRYAVLREHAKGGLGEVFVAVDQELKREVALKEIQQRYARDTSSRARFVLEAEITGGLEHPGIVPVYGLGQYADGRPYYAMRFIRGQNLSDAIIGFHQQNGPGVAGPAAANGPLANAVPRRRMQLTRRRRQVKTLTARNADFRKLLGSFMAVCNAVAYAHSRGVLHRDLKPSNIMLGAYGETLLLDWGLAKAAGRQMVEMAGGSGEECAMHPSSGGGVDPTQMGSAIGTPAYMSPEQAVGRLDELGPASDVYGLGATLYTLLTGQPPVQGRKVGDVLAKVQRGEFSRPRQIRPEVPAALEAVCMKAMALRPADRYQTPLALAGDVERWLADEPVSVYREPIRERLARWGRRHRTLATTVAALLVLAVIGSSAGSLLLATKNREVHEQWMRAEERDAQARSIHGFVTEHILAAAMPEGLGLGKDVTLRQALDAGARKISQAFQGQPTVEADIRESLGKSYFRLGAYAEAEEQFQRCVAVRKNTMGINAVETLRAMRWLARPLIRTHRSDQAAALLRPTLEGMRVTLGEDHAETLESMRILAQAYNGSNKHEQSEYLLKRALPSVRRLYGDDHEQTLIFLNDLGSALRSLRVYEEAEQRLTEAVTKGERLLGRDHPYTLTFRENFAQLLYSQGRVFEALRLSRPIVEANRRVRGDQHDETLHSMERLAEKLADSSVDECREAEGLRREVLSARQRNPDPADPDTLSAMTNLGRLLQTMGKYDEAEGLLRNVLETQARVLGAENSETLKAMDNLAHLLSQSKNSSEAEQLLRNVLATRTRILGAEHGDSLNSMTSLASFLRWNGAQSDAEALYQQVLDVRRRVNGPGHDETLAAMHALAWFYANCTPSQLVKSESIQRDILTALLRRAGVEQPELVPTAEKLAAVPLSRGYHAIAEAILSLSTWKMLLLQLSEAEELRLRIVKANRISRGPEDLRTIRSSTALAFPILCQGRLSEAESLYQEAAMALERLLGRDHLQTDIALHGLARVYLVQGKPEKAAELFSEIREHTQRRGGRFSYSDPALRALALCHLGRWQEACPLAEQALETAGKQFSPTDGEEITPAYVRSTLGWICLETGRLQDAENLLRGELERFRRFRAWPDDFQPHTESLLGAALAAQGRYEEAEPLLLRGAEALLKPPGCSPPPLHIRKAIERVIELYKSTGRNDEADVWRKRLPSL